MDERRGPSARPEPLGPGSLTWRYFGDWRGVLLAPWAGVMQNMHPELGAGVAEHSSFFEERWERLFRSLYPIGGVVYDGPRAVETARLVRGYHDQISGVDAKGRPYHALNPGTFYWAHATFFMLTFLVADRLGPGLSEARKRQLYQEHVRWYQLYGMSMRPVPDSWDDFQEYWDRMCAEVLEATEPARAVLDIRHIAKPPLLRRLPDWAWALIRVPQARFAVWFTVGMLPPAARVRLGYGWSTGDERRLRMLCRVIHHGWRLVPVRRRFHPRAKAGWSRVRGEVAADSGLVESPERYRKQG